MKLKKNNDSRKLQGVYYTPKEIAEFIVQLYSSEQMDSVLEPSCGEGIFIKCLMESRKDFATVSVKGIDIDFNAISKLQKEYESFTNAYFGCVDFYQFYELDNNQKYSHIFGNPPYIRYQYLTKEQREIQSKILKDNGMKPNKLINAWVCFMVAAVRLLEDNGSIAMVIPAEIMQVKYAESLREYLSDCLSEITIVNFQKIVFDDIEQETIVFIGKKGTTKKGIRVIEVPDVETLKTLELSVYPFIHVVNNKDKWTKYYVDAHETDLIEKLKDDDRFIQMKDICQINVGVTTGNNEFFSITKDVASKYDLDHYLIPLIGRSAQAHGIFFTEEDWQLNIESGKKAQLLAIDDVDKSELECGVLKYIEKGEQEGQHVGYKCSIRKHWYCIPSIYTPDAFFLRRNNLYPKFVLNKCGAISTDTMHRVKFTAKVDPEKILLSYYNSITFASTETSGRSYGAGVLEILPREAENIYLPKFDKVPKKICTKILKEIDQIVRNDNDIEKVLELVDKKILDDILGIPLELSHTYRQIWKKMQKRRLDRNNR